MKNANDNARKIAYMPVAFQVEVARSAYDTIFEMGYVLGNPACEGVAIDDGPDAVKTTWAEWNAVHPEYSVFLEAEEGTLTFVSGKA